MKIRKDEVFIAGHIPYEENHREEDGLLKKKCSLCEEWKPCKLEFFYAAKNKHDNLSPWCKKCSVKKATVRNQKDHDDYLTYIKDYRKNRYKEDEVLRNREKANGKRRRENGSFKKWQQANPEKLYQYYSHKILHRTHEITQSQWNYCVVYFNFECAYCGMSLSEHRIKYQTQLHREHVLHDGSNGLDNCVPSCKSCNSAKHTSPLVDWYNVSNPNYLDERHKKIFKWINDDHQTYL